jgi:hypothetical protein
VKLKWERKFWKSSYSNASPGFGGKSAVAALCAMETCVAPFRPSAYAGEPDTLTLTCVPSGEMSGANTRPMPLQSPQDIHLMPAPASFTSVSETV